METDFAGVLQFGGEDLANQMMNFGGNHPNWCASIIPTGVLEIFDNNEVSSFHAQLPHGKVKQKDFCGEEFQKNQLQTEEKTRPDTQNCQHGNMRCFKEDAKD